MKEGTNERKDKERKKKGGNEKTISKLHICSCIQWKLCLLLETKSICLLRSTLCQQNTHTHKHTRLLFQRCFVFPICTRHTYQLLVSFFSIHFLLLYFIIFVLLISDLFIYYLFFLFFLASFLSCLFSDFLVHKRVTVRRFFFSLGFRTLGISYVFIISLGSQ